ncbi:MAG: redox-sensing transcriptional repressor Rex [Deltaproteobacteria bacterium]|nr:redox-sensing transcriptional repressor Rex [Deltaproteobacteria bacterium]MBW1815958.1 redox-sensing transcriptional repressor Rex [Deltaproteobacteria bacterium]
MNTETKIPNPTIERLAFYSRPLEVLLKGRIPVVSSEKLAGLCSVNPAQVRKDLAYFGEFGVRGVGYDVRELLMEIKKILGTDHAWNLCIVGMGNLGKALVENENFKSRGYRFLAAFDNSPQRAGERLPCGLIIQSARKIAELVKALSIEIGVIATAPRNAQRTADMLTRAGVKAILNFAPTQLRTQDRCAVENVDFTVKLENLAYHLAKEE